MALSSIKDIPAIMRANKWLDGAQLMDKWFGGTPTVKPKYTTPDVGTIKMNTWVLTFPRAKSVYGAMVRDKIWSNPAARTRFAKVLKDGSFQPGSFSLAAKPVPEQHQIHINYRDVRIGVFDSLDDMVAALANFSIYVAPLTFDLASESAGFRVKLYQVGFHIVDSYDFEGDQDLGYWDETTNRASASWMYSGTNATNQTFRDWRTTNGKGGDFEVFSDVKVLTLTPPESFLL